MREIIKSKTIKSIFQLLGILLAVQGVRQVESQCVAQGEVCQYNNRLYYYEQQQYQLIANAKANNITKFFVNGQIVSLEDNWVQGGIVGDCQKLGPAFRISNYVNNTQNFYGMTGNGSIVEMGGEEQLTNEYGNNTITVISNVNGPEQQNTSVTTIPIETPENGFGSEFGGGVFTPVDQGTVLVPGLVEGQVPTPNVGAQEVMVPGMVPGEVQIPGTESAVGEGGLSPMRVTGSVPGVVASPSEMPDTSGQVKGTVPGLVPGLVQSPVGGEFGSRVAQSPGTKGIPINQIGNLSFGVNQQGVIQVTSNNTSDTINEILQEVNNNTEITTNTVYPGNINYGNINNGINNGIMNTGAIVQQHTTVGQDQQQIQNSTLANETTSIISLDNETMTGMGLGIGRPVNGRLYPPPQVLGAPPGLLGIPPSIFGVPPEVFGSERPESPPPVYGGIESGIAVYPSSIKVVQRKILRKPKLFKSIEKQYEKYNCENDEQCRECIEGYCYKCQEGYYMQNNESPCVQCGTINGCERCENYIGCIRCEEEYTLLQGTKGYNKNICI